MLQEPSTLEIQNARKVLKIIPCVTGILGTKRFVRGNPLTEFLHCMRKGAPVPEPVGQAFEDGFATEGRPGAEPALKRKRTPGC